jgi:DNA-directed RNA polymerase subunit RPC12/RpoP
VKSSREQSKARLMNQAGAVFDELLDWSEATAEPNLSEIEVFVGRLRKRLSEGMALEVINVQEARRPVPGPQCATCQQEMRYKGQKEVTIESWVGDLRMERGYYHCPDCGGGLFPPRPTV